MMERASLWLWFWLALGASGFLALLAMLGPHPLSLPAMERALERRVEAALQKNRLALDVVMDGQTARLEGVVSSEEAREVARRSALTAAGPGNVYIGGVTTVDMTHVVVGLPASPFVWSAVKDGDRMLLAGSAPSARARQAILAAAQEALRPRAVTDEMEYAVGAPEGEWTKVATEAVRQLASLNQGEARLEDNRLSILGEGDQPSVAGVQTFYRAPLPAPFTLASLDLVVQGQGLGIPELQGMHLARPQADECQKAFTIIMRRNVINFVTGSAEIDESSRALLNNLARVARRCDRFDIRISGHTDNVGDDASNLTLSQRRAETVRQYLVERGVASGRLEARGYGESAPEVSNDTEAGRARNRRIVFEVS